MGTSKAQAFAGARRPRGAIPGLRAPHSGALCHPSMRPAPVDACSHRSRSSMHFPRTGRSWCSTTNPLQGLVDHATVQRGRALVRARGRDRGESGADPNVRVDPGSNQPTPAKAERPVADRVSVAGFEPLTQGRTDCVNLRSSRFSWPCTYGASRACAPWGSVRYAGQGRCRSSAASMNSGNASMPSSAKSWPCSSTRAEIRAPRVHVDESPDEQRHAEHEGADSHDAGELHQGIPLARDAHRERSPCCSRPGRRSGRRWHRGRRSSGR